MSRSLGARLAAGNHAGPRRQTRGRVGWSARCADHRPVPGRNPAGSARVRQTGVAPLHAALTLSAKQCRFPPCVNSCAFGAEIFLAFRRLRLQK